MNHTVAPFSRNPFIVNCKLENIDMPFEIDSGSHVSTINKCYANKVRAVIKPTNTRLRGTVGHS